MPAERGFHAQARHAHLPQQEGIDVGAFLQPLAIGIAHAVAGVPIQPQKHRLAAAAGGLQAGAGLGAHPHHHARVVDAMRSLPGVGLAGLPAGAVPVLAIDPRCDSRYSALSW